MHILHNIKKYKYYSPIYQNILFHISHYVFQYIHIYFGKSGGLEVSGIVSTGTPFNFIPSPCCQRLWYTLTLGYKVSFKAPPVFTVVVMVTMQQSLCCQVTEVRFTLLSQRGTQGRFCCQVKKDTVQSHYRHKCLTENDTD